MPAGVDLSRTTTTTTTTTTTQPPADKPAPPPARPIAGMARELDALLLRAAQISTSSVDVETVRTTLRGAQIDDATRQDIAMAAETARDTFAALSAFTGGEIAEAYMLGEDDVNSDEVDDNIKNAAKAFEAAIEAQSKLAEKLHGIDLEGKAGNVSAAVTELALQCDRRQSEIISLAMQIADAKAHQDDPDIAARLDAKLSDLLPQQALSMHGNASLLEKIKGALKPIADRLTAFAKNPNVSLTSRDVRHYSKELDTFANAIDRAATKGFPAKHGRWKPEDGSLLAALSGLAKSAKATLANARAEIGMRSVKSFAGSKAFAFPNTSEPLTDPPPGVPGKKTVLPEIARNYPNLASAVQHRLNLSQLAAQYAANPDPAILADMRREAEELAALNKDDITEEIGIYAQKEFIGDYRCMKMNDCFRETKDMLPQVVHLEVMAGSVQKAKSSEQFLTTTSAQALLEGKLQFSTLVEARINGMSDADVNPALDDSRVVSSQPLRSGAVNTVTTVTYSDGAEYIFKPEGPGRAGMAKIFLGEDYNPETQVAGLNMATQRTADALGLGDVMVKTSVGCHQGEYGLFMEKAPGLTAEDIGKGEEPKTPGTLSAEQIRNLPDKDYEQVVGNMLRALNRLEWLDIITGQGDRHNGNYMIEVKEDLSVTVKGIDNDACFPANRTGISTFKLSPSQIQRFDAACAEIKGNYPQAQRAAAATRLANDSGVIRSGDGSLVIDAGKIQAAELRYALKESVGVQSSTLPRCIDAELYGQLIALKGGRARAAYKAELSSRLPTDAVDAAMNRLDEAIRHAEGLAAGNMVFSQKQFVSHDVQRQILAQDLAVPDNPVNPIDGVQIPERSSVVAFSRNMAKSLFARDLLPSLGKDNWFN